MRWPARATLVPALVLMTACGGTYVDDAPLDGAVLTGSSGRVLVLTGTHGSCDSVLPPEVVETPSQVRVRVPLRVQRGTCTGIGYLLREEVELEQPLGERTVVDDARDEPLEVTRP